VADKEMSVTVASAQAEATQGKNTAQQQIAQSNADLRIKQAEAARSAQVAENVAKADVEYQTFEAEGKAQEARAEMSRKQQYAERVVPAELSKQAAIVNAEAAAQQVTIAADADGKKNIILKQAEAVAAEAEAKKILALKTAEGSGIKAVLEGRAEGFRQLVASAGGNSNQAVVVLLADQLPEMIDAQMKGISNLKIDKIVVWGGGEGKSGVSTLLKDLITGLPPVTELARAAGVELPPVLGKVGSAIATDGPSAASATSFSHPSEPNGTPAAPEPRN
jgi:flotillin